MFMPKLTKLNFIKAHPTHLHLTVDLQVPKRSFSFTNPVFNPKLHYSGQRWFIDKFTKPGYPSLDGACFGVAGKGAESIAIDQLNKFDQRWKLINDTGSLAAIVEAAEVKRLHLIKSARKIYQPPDYYSYKLTNKDHEYLEINPFYENVVRIQTSHQLANLNLKNEEIPQNIILSSQLTSSIELEKQGGLKLVGNFSGLYPGDEMEALFTSYARTQSKLNFKAPIALISSSNAHTICYSFQNLNQIWNFIDANQLPSYQISKHKEMTTRTLDAFSLDVPFFEKSNLLDPFVQRMIQKKRLAVSTQMFCTGKNAMKAKSFMQVWQNTEEFKEIHKVSEQKAQLELDEDNKSSWLFSAIHAGQAEVVEALLMKGADPNQKDKRGLTPLRYALFHDRPGIVRLLLNYGADPNTESINCLPLEYAVSRQKKNMIKMLLQRGANPNAVKSNGCKPAACLTKQEDKSEIVDLLLHAEYFRHQNSSKKIKSNKPEPPRFFSSNAKKIATKLEAEKEDVSAPNFAFK